MASDVFTFSQTSKNSSNSVQPILSRSTIVSFSCGEPWLTAINHGETATFPFWEFHVNSKVSKYLLLRFDFHQSRIFFKISLRNFRFSKFRQLEFCIKNFPFCPVSHFWSKLASLSIWYFFRVFFVKKIFDYFFFRSSFIKLYFAKANFQNFHYKKLKISSQFFEKFGGTWQEFQIEYHGGHSLLLL